MRPHALHASTICAARLSESLAAAGARPHSSACTVLSVCANKLVVTRSCVRRVNDQIYEAVCLLSADPDSTIVISSGTTTAKLAEAFPNGDVWLAAENGAYLRPPRALWDTFDTAADGSEWICLYENLNLSWVASVQQVRRPVQGPPAHCVLVGSWVSAQS